MNDSYPEDVRRLTGVRRVLVLRHPETVANSEGRFLGESASPLTLRGEAQVRDLKQLVAEWAPEKIYTSPLERALSTAHVVAPAGVEVTVLDGLAEINFGNLEGLTWNEASQLDMLLDYDSCGAIAQGGETGAGFEARVCAAGLVIAGGARRSVVMTHGGVIRELCVHWLGIPREATWHISTSHGCALGFKLDEDWVELEILRPSGA